MFIGAQCPVYEGMIVGSNPKQGDIAVNVCKKKHLTAIRSAGADEALRLVTPKIMSLEEAIEYIADDELIEVTPKSLRLRKRILNTASGIAGAALPLPGDSVPVIDGVLHFTYCLLYTSPSPRDEQ